MKERMDFAITALFCLWCGVRFWLEVPQYPTLSVTACHLSRRERLLRNGHCCFMSSAPPPGELAAKLTERAGLTLVFAWIGYYGARFAISSSGKPVASDILSAGIPMLSKLRAVSRAFIRSPSCMPSFLPSSSPSSRPLWWA